MSLECPPSQPGHASHAVWPSSMLQPMMDCGNTNCTVSPPHQRQGQSGSTHILGPCPKLPHRGIALAKAGMVCPAPPPQPAESEPQRSPSIWWGMGTLHQSGLIMGRWWKHFIPTNKAWHCSSREKGKSRIDRCPHDDAHRSQWVGFRFSHKTVLVSSYTVRLVAEEKNASTTSPK